MTRWGGDALAGWIAGQRWFAGKSRRIVTVALEDEVPLPPGTLWLARVTLDDGRDDRYALPLLDGAAPRDALDDPGFCRALLDLIAGQARVAGRQGEVVASRTRAFGPGLAAGVSARRLQGEQSNSPVFRVCRMRS